MALQRPNCSTKIFLQSNSLRPSICLFLYLTEELKGIKTGPLLICDPPPMQICIYVLHLEASMLDMGQERRLKDIKRTYEHSKCGLSPITLQSLLCSVIERR